MSITVIVTFRNLINNEPFETEFEFEDIECATDFIKNIMSHNCTPVIKFVICSNKFKLNINKESDGKKVK